MLQTNDIRFLFTEEYQKSSFNDTIELIGASFLANEPFIFGKPNQKYIESELQWYESMSLNIKDIYGGSQDPPAAWQWTADVNGNINSNYGYLIWSEENNLQYNHALDELIAFPNSRRATMIYTRPQIWNDYSELGRSDFICTNAVTYYIREGFMHCVVQMRSNDAWAGYRNDYAWQQYVLNKITNEYNELTGSELKVGNMFWQVQNLHIYRRNYYLLDHFIRTGETHITKEKYQQLYD